MLTTEPPRDRFTQWNRDRPHHHRKSRGQAFFSPPREEPPTILPGQGVAYFESNVKPWVGDQKTREIIEAFGIPSGDLSLLYKAFESAVTSRCLSTPQNVTYYDLNRFNEPMDHLRNVAATYSTIFFAWANNPSNRELLLSTGVQPSTLDTIERLVEASSRKTLLEEGPLARRIRRKVIMHVGPTNSGKTYHALRALAAAKSGTYAGPLRLLAHEIWERLNLGQIAPAGAEAPDFEGTEVTRNLDALPHAEAIKKHGNPQYARLCNMITGEEQKIVHEDAALVSCTVEMMSFRNVRDVGVLDEIQMISDPQRGGAWTTAVLGFPARELHLCGEETAVPVVKELLKESGDEIVVKRYERLTPLAIEEKSLHGDWKNIQKGDAVVAFSRTGIFKIKKEIEEATGLRCAVVYGRLPPEIRSEQAALFNDPNSGYDVLVGSDAIGMGLNLKIRRVVFHEMHKHAAGAKSREPLSVSQVKQIAGRAGRFGMQTGSEAPGGFATTFQEDDMTYLREALATPFTGLPFARLAFTDQTFRSLTSALPRGSSTATVFQAHHYISPLPPKTRYHESDTALLEICDFVDKHSGKLSMEEKLMHFVAPVSWRDPHIVDAVKKYMTQAARTGTVDFHQAMGTSSAMDSMKTVERAKEQGHSLRKSSFLISDLETLHKAMVLYIWMSYRAPVVYSQGLVVRELKEKVERLMQWALEDMSGRGGKEKGASSKRLGRPDIQWRSRHEARQPGALEGGHRSLARPGIAGH